MNQFPPEIMKEILKHLNYIDIESAYHTCVYWRNIIDEYQIWKHQWYEIIRVASRSLLGSKICDNLLKTDLEDKDPMGAISRLKRILLINKRRKALTRRCCQINSYSYNSMGGSDGDYFSRCEFDNSLKCIDRLFSMSTTNRLHVRTVFYIYPLDLSEHVTKKFIKHLFEEIHISKIVIIPRILLYSINFKCDHSIIIHTHEDCTEIGVIINNVIDKDRWIQLPYTYEDLHQQKNPIRDQLVMKVNDLDEDCADKKRLKIYMPNIYDLRPYIKKNKCMDGSNSPEAYLINKEFYKEMELANVIKKLLEGLPHSTVNKILQGVFLVGAFHDVAFIDSKLKSDLDIIFPEHVTDTVVYVENECVLYDCCRQLCVSDLNELHKKYSPGAPYCLSIEDYIVSGTEDF